MGVVFVVSSMMKKPILWLLARHQAKSEEHKTALEHPDRKKMLGTVNAVWGWSFVLEFRAVLILGSVHHGEQKSTSVIFEPLNLA
jgi:hypothetical protein